MGENLDTEYLEHLHSVLYKTRISKHQSAEFWYKGGLMLTRKDAFTCDSCFVKNFLNPEFMIPRKAQWRKATNLNHSNTKSYFVPMNHNSYLIEVKMPSFVESSCNLAFSSFNVLPISKF